MTGTVGVFEVARNMGTSVQIIQEYYGKQATSVPQRAPCFSRPPQSRYLFEGWAFDSVTDVATDGAGILTADC